MGHRKNHYRLISARVSASAAPLGAERVVVDDQPVVLDEDRDARVLGARCPQHTVSALVSRDSRGEIEVAPTDRRGGLAGDRRHRWPIDIPTAGRVRRPLAEAGPEQLDATSATVAAWFEMCPSWCGKPVRKLAIDRIPTACCDRPVSNDARVGEHSGVTWKLVDCSPPASSASTWGVSMVLP